MYVYTALVRGGEPVKVDQVYRKCARYRVRPDEMVNDVQLVLNRDERA